MNNPLKEIPATDRQLPQGSWSRKKIQKLIAAKVAAQKMLTVTVSIHGGVGEVVRKPAGVTVELLDFDIEGCEEEDLCRAKSCRYEDDHVHSTWDQSEEFDGYKANEKDKEVS